MDNRNAAASIWTPHPETALRRRDDEALLSQPGQSLTHRRLAHAESSGELDHPHLLARREQAVEELRVEQVADPGGAGRRRTLIHASLTGQLGDSR
jgi:hypothetical protein